MKNIIYFAIFVFCTIPVFAQDYGTGLQFNDENYDKVKQKAPLTRSLYNNLPSQASLKMYAPIPKSQGAYGTCVGWSTAYCALTIVEALKNGWTDKDYITDNTFSPGFIYKQVKASDDHNCKFGVSIDDALYVICTKGAAPFNDLEEKNCPASIPNTIFQKAEKYRLQDYARLFNVSDNYDTKIETTKKSISENKPVVIGMKMPDSFYNAKDVWEPTEDYNLEFGGHAMCVVGYDDDKYGGAFEIQNSWGLNWGNEGYIWIKYTDYANFVKYAFELIEPLASNKVAAKLSGKVKFVNADGNTMSATFTGNRFKMDNSYKSGTQFRIYISNNEPAYVYAFGSDETKQTFQIFPHLENISPLLNYKKNDVAIPDENHFIEMDNTIGTDYLCVLYSRTPLNIADIQLKVKAASGNFQQKVVAAIGANLIEFNDVTYEGGDEFSFNANTKGKTVVALMVETTHVK